MKLVDDDQEAEFNANFDPEDLSRWSEYSAIEVIGMLVHEIREQTLLIDGWIQYSKKMELGEECEVKLSDGEYITVQDLLDLIVSRDARITRLLDLGLALYADRRDSNRNEQKSTDDL